VRRRVKALKKLQAETHKIESRFFEEVHELECKFSAQYEPVTQKVCNSSIEIHIAIGEEGGRRESGYHICRAFVL